MSDWRYYSRDLLVAHGRSKQWHTDGEIYAIDLDGILRMLPEPTDEQRYQHAERTWINAYAECQSLRPDANPDDAIATELVRLRGECERMRAVCDRSVNLIDGWGRRAAPADLRGVGELANAVDAYRSAAPIASQPTPTLTPAESEALDEARAWFDRADGALTWNRAAIRAIDKLMKARPT